MLSCGGKMKKLNYLEGLRGVAAFIVFVAHFVQLFYPAMIFGDSSLLHNSLELDISRSPVNLLFNGSFAVFIFFVLSGYVLSIKFTKENSNYEILYSSAVRRYFRLAIPSAVSLVIAYILMKSNLLFYKDITETTNGFLNNHFSVQPSFVEFISQFFGSYFVSFYKEKSLNPVLWTMHYELLGSFLIFILMALFSKVKNRLTVYLSYLFIMLLLISPFPYFVAFILGLLISDVQNSKYKNLLGGIQSNKFSTYFLLFLGLLLGSYPYVDTKGSIYQFIDVVFSYIPLSPSIVCPLFGSLLVLVSFLRSNLLQTIFSKNFFVFLGKISFSLYLLHFILLSSFSSWLFSQVYGNYSYNFSCLIVFVVTMVLLLLISYLMYRTVDKSSILISSKIYKVVFKGIFVKLQREDKVLRKHIISDTDH
jgi:peptidoglycan/LPS O-acetylase OafA/YrhL